MCVCCVKGCASPVELCVVEEVVDTIQGGKIGILMLLCVYLLMCFLKDSSIKLSSPTGVRGSIFKKYFYGVTQKVPGLRSH